MSSPGCSSEARRARRARSAQSSRARFRRSRSRRRASRASPRRRETPLAAPERGAGPAVEGMTPVAAGPARPYRGVLFGAGGVARNAHLPAFSDPEISRRLEIVAVVEPDGRQPVPSGLPRLANRSDIAGLGQIDFIDICTPTSSHLDLTLWGLEH